jgi:hypothetical protein
VAPVKRQRLEEEGRSRPRWARKSTSSTVLPACRLRVDEEPGPILATQVTGIGGPFCSSGKALAMALRPSARAGAPQWDGQHRISSLSGSSPGPRMLSWISNGRSVVAPQAVPSISRLHFRTIPETPFDTGEGRLWQGWSAGRYLPPACAHEQSGAPPAGRQRRRKPSAISVVREESRER